MKFAPALAHAVWRLDTITGALTLVAMHLVGDGRTAGWAVGLVAQAFWIVLIVRRRLWGLAPLAIALVIVYTRNLLAWGWAAR